LIQAAEEKGLSEIAINFKKIYGTARPPKSDLVSMPRQRKRGSRPASGSDAKNEDGGTVCALCGRVIKPGSAASDEPVIYSICATCKRMPYRNPGSTASLC
jgi:hypothetical protein